MASVQGKVPSISVSTPDGVPWLEATRDFRNKLLEYEACAFENFVLARDNGLPLPYRDTPKAGAFKIAEREHAAQAVESGAIYGDCVAQARARLSGDILSGLVRDVTVTRVGRKNIHRFVVETARTNLHMRQRDESAWLDDPRLRCVTEGVDKQDTLTRVQFRISAGMRSIGPPQNGAELELAPPPPDRGRLGRERAKTASRLATLPWTHRRDTALPADAAHETVPPGDLLAAIEALR